MNTRALIMQADEIARGQGLNQTKWSSAAGKAGNGQTVSRILAKGDCRMSTMLDLLAPLGYELAIVQKEDL